MKYLKLLRVKHYLKNVLVFLPLIFSGRLLEQPLLAYNLIAFVIFCLLSSAIYIINDIRDVQSDRNHPTKCRRPIASGAISMRMAYGVMAALLVCSIALSLVIGSSFWAFSVLGCYLLLNILYSFGLKHIPIVDIAILASGFLLRVVYGSTITGIEISKWLYLTVISMAFYMGLGKRRNEMICHTGGETRPVLQHYTRDFLDKNLYVFVTLAIVFYSLWSLDPVTTARHNGDALVWTVPLVILICLRYSLDIEGHSDGDPVEVLTKDKTLLAFVLALGLAMLGILYL